MMERGPEERARIYELPGCKNNAYTFSPIKLSTQWYKMAPPPGQSTTRAISGGFVPPTTLAGHGAGEDEEEGGGSMEPVAEGAPLRPPRVRDACARNIKRLFLYGAS